MIKYNVLPFITISAENLDLADEMLSREEKGELLEMIIEFVRGDSEPVSSNKCVNATFKQFMSVIERKSSAYFGRKEQMDKVNQKKKKQAQPEQKEEAVEEKPMVSCYSTFNERIADIAQIDNKQKQEMKMNQLARDYKMDFFEIKNAVEQYGKSNSTYNDTTAEG